MNQVAAAPRHAYAWFAAGMGSWALAAGLQQVLFAWLLVGELHESARWVGVAQMCQMLPALLLMLAGGVVADRVELRRLLGGLHVAAAAAAASLAFAVSAGRMSLGLLIGYALVWGTIQTFAGPARDAMISHVSGRDLMRAVTGTTLVMFIATAAGSRLGGIGARLGNDGALALQAAVLIAGLVAVVRLPRAEPHPRRAGDPGGLAAMRDGLREVRASARLFPVALLVAGDGLFFMGPFAVLVPILVRDVYQGQLADLSSVMMVLPLGTIAGSLTVLLRGGIRRKGRAFLLSLFGVSACLLAIAAGLPFPGLLVTIFAWGIFHSVFFNTSRTLFQEAAPPALRARVLSVHSLGFLGMAPFSHLGAGLLAEAVGPLVACAMAGAAMVLLTGVALVATPVWRLE